MTETPVLYWNLYHSYLYLLIDMGPTGLADVPWLSQRSIVVKVSLTDSSGNPRGLLEG